MLETGKEGSMKRIVLDMQCAMFANAISQALERSDPDFNVLRAEAPEKTAALCRSSLAYALNMEVTGYPPGGWRNGCGCAMKSSVSGRTVRSFCWWMKTPIVPWPFAFCRRRKTGGSTILSMHPYLPLIWQPCWIRFEQNTTTIYKEES